MMTLTNSKTLFSATHLRPLALAASIAIISACGGGGGGSYQNDKVPPVAAATAVGLGSSTSTTNKTFSARSNSEVVLTGKDSDSSVAPILEFDWLQTAGPSVTLVERTANSVAFDTPDVVSDATLTFQLTVTDANGRSDTDEVTVDVSAISDANRFLADPRVAENKLTVLAALEGGESTGASEQLFTVEVVTVAHWRNQDGDMDQLAVDTQIIDGVFPANFSPAVGYAPLTEPRNPLLEVELVRLDADDINQNFETSNRQRRLESYEIPSAYLEVQISITSAPAINFELFALNNQNDETLDGNDIEGSTTTAPAEFLAAVPTPLPISDRSRIDIGKIDSPVNTAAASNGAILQTSTGLMSTSLLTTNVLNELGLESHITANAYYNLIDPNGEFTTFSAWAQNAGFKDANNNDIDDPDNAHALYVNNYDLGFGRDMYLRKADNGNVYTYVTNYPTLEAGIEQRGEFAIVAMEYSENPDPDGANAKIVKFFVYSADERSGGFIRVNSLNFDGGGERFVPGVCTVCHQDYPGSRDYSDVSQADLGATFIPWDLDSFLYSKANDAALVEPTLNTNEFSAAQIDQFSRETQESELRKLNLGALATYVDDPERHDASIQLIHGWYGDPDQELPIDELPDNDFDGSYIPAGWVGQEELYREVFSRTCRICHTQVGNKEKNFDSYEEFIGKKDIITNYVFEQGLMPIARLSFDRFWVDYNAGDSSSTLLRNHLEGLGDIIPAAPGLPVPKFLFDRETATIDDTISVNASSSVFSKTYSWTLTTPAGSTSSLNNSSGITSSFSADLPGGSYDVTLTTTNKNGASASFTNTFVIDNRAPVAECLTANTSGMTTAGALSNIPVVSLINGLGDGGVLIDSTVNGSFGTVTIDANAQTLSYQLNDPFNRGVDTIEYQLVDFDGSPSTTANGCVTATDGFASITIDSTIVGTSAPASASASPDAINNTTEIDVSWTAPTGIAPDGYNVYRNANASGVPLNSSLLSGTSFSDNNNGSGLTAGTSYNYSVEAIINGFASQPTTTSAATLSLTPTGLTASNDGMDTIDETQIELSWSVPPAGSATVDSYTIFRDEVAVDTSATNSYSDSGLTPGTAYSYQVNANDGVQDSPLSNAATQSTRPLAPSALILEAGADARTDITLSWTAPAIVNEGDVYMVYRDNVEATMVGSTTFADSGLSASTNYSYFITTISDKDNATLKKESAPSNTANLSTAAAGAGEATDLAAALDTVNDATEIDLSWAAPTAFTAEGYNLYRSVNGAAATLIGTQPTTLDTSYTDINLLNDTQYEYQIAAISGGVEQALTGKTGAATATTLSLLPTALTAGTVTASTIDFSWTSPAANEDANFAIARSIDAGANYTDLGTTSSLNYSDSGLASATSYVYRVTATQGADMAQNTISISTAAANPTALSAAATSTSQITVSWTAPTGNVTGVTYNVYRDGAPTAIATGVAATSYADSGLASATSYSYRVTASFDGQESADATVASIGDNVATTIPEVPGNVVAVNGSATTGRIVINWDNDPDGTDLTWDVYRNNTFQTNVATSTYTDTTGLASGTQYTYRVEAVTDGNSPVASANANGQTLPATPTTVVADASVTANGSDAIRVSSYDVSCTGDTPTYTITTTGTNAPVPVVTTATTADVGSLNSNTSYSFTVSAECNDVSSASSSAASATTELSYANNIAGLAFLANAKGTSATTSCTGSGCHGEPETRLNLTLTPGSTCITNDNSLSDCDPSMTFTITNGEITIINNWRTQGHNR
jgi:hypothetical protein